MKKQLILMLTIGAALLASAQYVENTITLNKGWNAIYLEATPEKSAPDEFFKDKDVTRVGSYQRAAYKETAQYDSEGNIRNQKPISYLVWEKGGTSTLKNLRGGNCYLVYATTAQTITYLGTPVAPQMTWRDTASGEMAPLVAPSLPEGTSVTAAEYFAEGPYDKKGVYEIIGQNETAPQFLPSLGAKPKVTSGKAYALGATQTTDWPGVLEVRGDSGDALHFAAGESVATLTIVNRGTKTREVKVELINSAKTEETLPPVSGLSTNVTIEAGARVNLKATLDRSSLDKTVTYAGVVVVSDLGGTKMRVRLPVTADPKEKEGEEDFPKGFWAGIMRFEAVSTLVDPETVAKAAGALELNVLIKVDADGKAHLLQRATLGGADVKRRVSTVFLSVENPDIEGEGTGFAKDSTLVFKWDVASTAKDNPFRHAHHPDHNGDMAHEVWDISNTLTFYWTDDVVRTADEKTYGYVKWEVGGLTKEKITSVGVFVLKRMTGIGEVE